MSHTKLSSLSLHPPLYLVVVPPSLVEGFQHAELKDIQVLRKLPPQEGLEGELYHLEGSHHSKHQPVELGAKAVLAVRRSWGALLNNLHLATAEGIKILPNCLPVFLG